MAGFMDRRALIKGSLAAGAMLALPGRALGQAVGSDFERLFRAAGAESVPPVAEPVIQPIAPQLPTSVPPNPAYDRRVFEIAKREVERAGPSVWRRDIVGIADFGRPSSLPRFHFANLENGTIRSFYVAHGRGSDPEHSGFLRSFSDVPGSEATSRGAYLTAEWYRGKYGTSIRLVGLDRENHTALERAIVMHPAAYAAPSHIAQFGKLGRSEGCFAMAPEQFNEALWHLSGGRLLYADRIDVS
jgi:L,D-transpeptidase catalytic domain